MRRDRTAAVVFVIFFVVGGLLVNGSTSGFPIRLPDGVAGWTKSEETVYTPETIFTYIDGGAELYLSYGLSSVLSRTYTREGGPEIIVDVFDMIRSKNAFGVFSQSRETVDDAFGQGSQYTRGLLVFWKDKYYVSILASPETKESEDAVMELARRIDDAIPGDGPLPEILRVLPAELLVEESVRYFRHYVWLNSHYYVADENILHIDESTDAVLAKYKSGDARWFLLVVEYPGETEALAARSDFVKEYLPEAKDDSVVRIEDRTWTGFRLVGNVLAVVFNAPTKETAEALLAKVEENTKPGGETNSGEDSNPR